jgi:hypothetical protein
MELRKLASFCFGSALHTTYSKTGVSKPLGLAMRAPLSLCGPLPLPPFLFPFPVRLPRPPVHLSQHRVGYGHGLSFLLECVECSSRASGTGRAVTCRAATPVWRCGGCIRPLLIRKLPVEHFGFAGIRVMSLEVVHLQTPTPASPECQSQAPQSSTIVPSAMLHSAVRYVRKRGYCLLTMALGAYLKGP